MDKQTKENVETTFVKEWMEGGQFGYNLEASLRLNFRLIGLLVDKGILTEDELIDLQNTWLDT